MFVSIHPWIFQYFFESHDASKLTELKENDWCKEVNGESNCFFFIKFKLGSIFTPVNNWCPLTHSSSLQENADEQVCLLCEAFNDGLNLEVLGFCFDLNS